MWIQTQKGDEILEVKRIKVLEVDDDVTILAKLDRETVTLGVYPKYLAWAVVEDLQDFIIYGDDMFVMPPKPEDEE